MNIKKTNFEQMISKESLKKRIKEIGISISKKYTNDPPVLVCVLSGAFVFCADLFREIKLECEIDFIKVSSYSGSKSKGSISIEKDVSLGLIDRHVILIEDIVDSGLTINYLYSYIKKKKVKTISTASLLYKPEASRFSFKPDWIGFEIPSEFVIGYGLDYNQKYRNLKGIYRLKK